ncbi:MAG: DNA polymerase ligase N-terminal domain-containing protein [Nanoarchaeota archaeon]
MSLEQYKKKRKKPLPTLSAYAKKRKFSETPEPAGKSIKTSGKKTIFVIHDHHASHHHYDLRLEMNGVLASWAVPKEPPISKGTKRLAIHVEDHPLEYAKFHGTIPEGNYGAGKVEIWDSGNYVLRNKNPDKIEFELKGKKLKGNFILIKTSYVKNGWLWFKV